MARSLHSKEYAKLVAVLVAARKGQGMTQQQLADALKKPQSYIAKIEGGERRVDLLEFTAIAKAMGLEPIKLYGKYLEA